MSTPTTPTRQNYNLLIYKEIHFGKMSGLYRFPRFSTPLHHVENLKFSPHFWVVERWWRGGGEVFRMC